MKLPGTKVSTPCEFLRVIVSEGTGTLTIESIQYGCGGISYSWQTPAHFSIDAENNVLFDGVIVGEVNPNKDKFEFTIGTPNGILEVKFQIINGQMLFQEVLEAIDGSGRKASGILSLF